MESPDLVLALKKLMEWKKARRQYHVNLANLLAQVKLASLDDLARFTKPYALIDCEHINLVAGGEEIILEIHQALSTVGLDTGVLSTDVNTSMLSIQRDDLFYDNPRPMELERLLAKTIRKVRSEATRKGINTGAGPNEIPSVSDMMLEMGYFSAAEKVRMKVGVENEDLFLPAKATVP